MSIPAFSDLPLNKGDPWLSAWGLYGKDDELGTLNRLTSEVVLEAAKEIQTGTRISLNWPLDKQTKIPFFGRQVFKQHMYDKAPRCVNDDTWSFNTQSSTQWDGLRHYAYQKERKFYNGVTLEQIHTPGSTVLGIQAMEKHGIVGRGILIDYAAYCERHGIAHNAFESQSIKLTDLQACAKEQGTEIKFGDILMVRSGYMPQFEALTAPQLESHASVLPPHLAGVEQSEQVLQWLWENFSAVASDHPAFEVVPPKEGYNMMHEVILSGWGMPIGEMFDLEALARECSRQKRWSFFVSSEVCHVPGGVASPPNALAIM